MEPVYLSSLKISDFRTYGPEFSISFPKGPSLTVVSGMNGLGKTTLFDAIEWGLLGDIQRFHGQRLPTADSPLTRREADRNSHRVELAWGDRRFVRTHLQGPDSEELKRLLHDPQWLPGVQNIDVYLRLTHFLPQSSRQRFLNQDEKERWSLLRGPTGVDRLERFRKLLDDIKARKAFDRRVESLDQHLAETKRQQTEWRELLSEQNRWTVLAQAGDAIPPEKIGLFLDELSTLLPNRSSTALRETGERLIQVRQALTLLIEQHEDRLGQLNAREKTIPRFLELGQQLDVLRQSLLGSDEKLKQAKAELEQQTSEIKRNLQTLDEKKSLANARAVSLLLIIEALASRDQNAQQLTSLNARLRAVTTDIETIQAERNAHQRAVGEHENALDAAATLREKLAVLEHAEKLFADVRTQERHRETLGSEITEWETKKLPMLQLGGQLDQEAIEVDRRHKDLIDKLAANKLTIDEVAQARTTLVEHITSEDRICPVCAHEHPPGVLLHRAQAKLYEASNRTSILVESLKKTELDREDVRRRQHCWREDFAAIEIAINARKEHLRAGEALKQTLLAHPLVADTPLPQIDARLRELGISLHVQQDEVNRKVTSTRLSDEAIAAGKELDRRDKVTRELLVQLDGEQRSVTKLLQDQDAKLKATEATIAECGGSSGLPVARNQLLRTIAEAETQMAVIHEQLALVQQRMVAADRAAAKRDAQRKADQQAVAVKEKELASIVAAWREADLAGTPAVFVLSEERTRVDKERNALLRGLDRLKQAAAGLEAWNNRQELTRVSESLVVIRNRFGKLNNEDCSKQLALVVETAEANLGRARETSKRAGEVAQALRQCSTEFSQNALAPLSARISAFHRLLSPFPYGVALKPHLTGTSGKAQTTLAVPSLKGLKSSDEDPDFWLSEGQASALGLSVLLGASTVYHWSTWRALLLDDPLQNNDLIHTAAFGDVIRSLMQDEGYQVIVSTHDQDEADYLLRKVRRAGLPVQQLELVSLSPRGVRYDLREN